MTTSGQNGEDWANLIGQVATCRNELASIQPDNWPNSFGGIAATGESIAVAEHDLGFALDPDYREFLLHLNGWPDFYSDISILALDQLGHGAAWARACQLLEIFYGYPPKPNLPQKGELFPIAISAFQSDVLAVIRTGQTTGLGHPIIWLANDEVERFPNMKEMVRFYLTEMNRELTDLTRPDKAAYR
jgi:hypothetical protein